MIYLKNTSNADSRTCNPGEVSKTELLENSLEHKRNVSDGMYLLASLIAAAGEKHDFTKVRYINEFYESFQKNDDDDFKKGWWYQNHILKERHHLNARCPDDVNLIDVLEHLVDCVMAGKGRSGHINEHPLTFKDEDLLEKAYWNTVKLLDESTIIEED